MPLVSRGMPRRHPPSFRLWCAPVYCCPLGNVESGDNSSRCTSYQNAFRFFMPKYVVRTGVMRALGVASSSRDDVFARSAQVIVRTERGLEAGEVLSEATEQVLSQMKESGQGQIL